MIMTQIRCCVGITGVCVCGDTGGVSVVRLLETAVGEHMSEPVDGRSIQEGKLWRIEAAGSENS